MKEATKVFDDRFNFNDLFIMDMANNHQGMLEHGKSIIDDCASVMEEFDVRVGIKFQFRNIPDFIHKNHRDDSDNKHVPRFISTSLSWDEFETMKKYADSLGLMTICTPFDEFSVKKIVEMNFDIIKIASCSALDWPLLETVAKCNKPVIVSTGGLSIEDIDRVVSFFSHRASDFSLMHCVAIYPTEDQDCNLDCIRQLKERFPNLTIGWSTHEPPEETMHVGLAYTLGARIMERHVGRETKTIKLNKYSSSLSDLQKWIKSWKKSKLLIGIGDRSQISDIEKDSILALSRGVFISKDIKSNEQLNLSDVYFAFPRDSGQLASGDFKAGLTIKNGLKKNEPLVLENVTKPFNLEDHCESILKTAIHKIKALLNKARVTLDHNFTAEYSHHFGITHFFETGTVLITIVNRAYAKKILVQLENQAHPLHMHKLKEETFICIYGDLIIEIDNKEITLSPGQQVTVPAGIWHRFTSQFGCVFEEISSTAYPNDSYYKDESINQLSSAQRKTIVDHWGKFTLTEQIRSKRN